MRVGTSGISSSRRATERGTMFHEEGVVSGNENESRAGSSYGIRNLLSHLNPTAESAGGTLSERLEKSFTKEELRVSKQYNSIIYGSCYFKGSYPKTKKYLKL